MSLCSRHSLGWTVNCSHPGSNYSRGEFEASGNSFLLHWLGVLGVFKGQSSRCQSSSGPDVGRVIPPLSQPPQMAKLQETPLTRSTLPHVALTTQTHTQHTHTPDYLQCVLLNTLPSLDSFQAYLTQHHFQKRTYRTCLLLINEFVLSCCCA